MRAAFQDPARYPCFRLAGIVALILQTTARVPGDTADFRRVRCVFGGIEVARPFPDIADHVMKPVAVGREGHDWRCALEAVLREVLARELALPDVGHVTAAGSQFVAPGELRLVEPAAGGELPLRLARQILAGPLRIGECV